MGKHAAANTDYPFYPEVDGPDAFEVEEIADVLSAMPLDGDELGDGSASDWTLTILIALAGWGEPDTLDYVTPRLEAAAKKVLAKIGCPGPAFAGLYIPE